MNDDTINRQAALDALNRIEISRNASWYEFYQKALTAVGELPPAQPQKEIPKRVVWTGWKGYRDTRYKCPNCEKPVRNDDAYCHRCGQRLLFPNISFTDYVPGQGHELIVRWDDEG